MDDDGFILRLSDNLERILTHLMTWERNYRPRSRNLANSSMDRFAHLCRKTNFHSGPHFENSYTQSNKNSTAHSMKTQEVDEWEMDSSGPTHSTKYRTADPGWYLGRMTMLVVSWGGISNLERFEMSVKGIEAPVSNVRSTTSGDSSDTISEVQSGSSVDLSSSLTGTDGDSRGLGEKVDRYSVSSAIIFFVDSMSAVMRVRTPFVIGSFSSFMHRFKWVSHSRHWIWKACRCSSSIDISHPLQLGPNLFSTQQ